MDLAIAWQQLGLSEIHWQENWSQRIGWIGVLPLFFLLLGLIVLGLKLKHNNGESLFPNLALFWCMASSVALLGLRREWASDFVIFRPELNYAGHDRYFYPATLFFVIYIGIIWSQLRGASRTLASILIPCWTIVMYLWGYTFFPGLIQLCRSLKNVPNALSVRKKTLP